TTTRVFSTTATSRSARRRARTATAARPQSVLERYRNVLLILFAIVGIGVVAFVFIRSASAQPYVCDTLLTPGPVETDPPAPSLTVAPSVSAAPSVTVAPSGRAAASVAASPTAA